MKLIADALRLASLLGLISPWLPDDDSERLAGWDIVWWYVSMAVLLGASFLLDQWAERRQAREAATPPDTLT